MKIKNKILSFFKLNKFDIVCKNYDEWVEVQEQLIKDGYLWEECYFVNNIYITPATAGVSWPFPVIIKNYRSGDRFGGKFLIIDDYRYVIRCQELKLIDNVELINAISFLRLRKLKNIARSHR